MPLFEPPETAQAAADVINALVDSAWVLAAAVDVLGCEAAPGKAIDDAPARVLAAAGLFAPGSGGLAPVPGMAALMAADGRAWIEAARSALGQVSAVATGRRLEDGWTSQDDETLIAQGAASGRLVPSMLAILFGELPKLEERVRTAGARMLDVGVGVGGMACALAEAIPSLSVVGIDPFERALRLASQQVAARGLEERVHLRMCSVEDVDDEEVFDVAWLPAPFLAPEVFKTGVSRVYQAVVPGGWILVGMGRLDGESVSTAVTRWQTELIGGTPLTPQEASSLLVQTGFTDVVVLDTPPGTPVVVAARRPLP